MKSLLLAFFLMIPFTFAHAGEWQCTLRVAPEKTDAPEKVYPGTGNVAFTGTQLTGSFSFKTFSMSFQGNVGSGDTSAPVSGTLSADNKVFDGIAMTGTFFATRPTAASNGARVLHLSGSGQDLSCVSYDLGARPK